MSAEFDQLVAEFEQFQSKIHQADERFANLAGISEELTSLEVSAASPDRAVTVVAGPGGSVKDIRFTEAAMQYGPQRLASVVMSTLHEAIAESARQQALIVQEHVGGDEPILDQVLETQAEVTGMSVEELRAKVESDVEPARRPRAEAGDEEESLVFRDTPPPPQAVAESGSDADNFLRNLSEED